MAKEVTRAETTGSALLWFGLLAAPVAWSVMAAAPVLAEVLCFPGAGDSRGEIYGIDHVTFFALLLTGLTVIAIASLVVSYRCWRKLNAEGAQVATAGRANWMALASMLVSVLFLVGIVFGFFPLLFLSSCVPAL